MTVFRVLGGIINCFISYWPFWGSPTYRICSVALLKESVM